MKRKKRLKKGIASLEKQLTLHQEKQAQAEESGKEELADYYEREIAAKARDLKKKKLLLER